MGVVEWIRRLRFGSLNRGRSATTELGSVEGTMIPPNYVNSYDEGRPKH
ncbi:MAG TPA: hypothetical protein VHQ98_05765 [Gaiellaceae bacterium]|jgi:hypothetical protein|nr:hypothetical protein [Gaiellaceae bacterium]